MLPKADGSVKILPEKTAASSSFIGGSCGTCRLPSGKKCHSINEKPVCIILGDEYCPILCGDRGACCPTIRVQSGTFAQLKSLLTYHFEAGLKVKPGSVAVVLLLSHLLRIGHDDFWSELIEFTNWASTKHLTILPGIPIYPTGLRDTDLMLIGQFVQHLVVANYGAVAVNTRKNYEFWRPAVLSLQQHHADGINITAPPTRIPELDNKRFDTTVNVSKGLQGDWRKGVPATVELSFLINLLASLQEFSKKSSKELSLPSEDDIRSGLQFEPAPASSPHQGKTIVLLGHSIISSAKFKLDAIVNPLGVQVSSLCKTGVHYKELFEGHSLDALSSTKPSDVLVVSFLGNYLLHQQQVSIDYPGGQKTIHLLKPTIINSADFQLLVDHMNKALGWLRINFPGKIVVINVIPRHTTPCCTLPDHIIVDHGGKPVPMLKYVKCFNELLDLKLHLPHNTILADYRDIFGTESPELFDGVHLKRSEQAVLAEFIASTLDMTPTPEIPAQGCDETFHDCLVRKEIISDTLPPPSLPSPFMEVNAAQEGTPAANQSAAAGSSAPEQAIPATTGPQAGQNEATDELGAIDDAIRLLLERKKALS